MKSNLRQALKEFHQLPRFGQDSLLRDLHKASKDNALMIESRLLGDADFGDLIAKMERETIGKIYKRGSSKMIDGRKVNAIIAVAKKARANYELLMQLEQLAYRGFTEFLHKYGGGSESYNVMGPNHLRAYLQLVKDNYSPDRAVELYDLTLRYLRQKDNMNQDYNFDAFEEITGISAHYYE